MQLHRVTCMTVRDMLRGASSTVRDTCVPPVIMEDMSIDESGADGMGLCYMQLLGGSKSDADIIAGKQRRCV